MSLQINRKATVITLIGGAVIFGTYAFSPAPPHGDHEHHLKVLKKDISDEQLMQVMESYKVALNFHCDDCHAHSATDSTKMDFASYDNHHKQVALDMMKMVAEINEKHFGIKGDFTDNYLQSKYKVTCNTCHDGHEEPAHRVTIPIPRPRR